MKRNKFILPVTAFALLLTFGLAACGNNGNGGGGSQQQSQAAQEKITITAAGEKTKLILGETVQLTASVPGVTWSSSKEDVATVDANGLVTSKGVGSTTIKAVKDGYKDGSLSIKVDLQNINVTAAGETTLVMEQTLQLTADQQGVTWSSSDANIASVDQTGKVTAVGPGSTQIKASKDGFNDGKISITVTRPAPLATLHFEDADHYSADGWWGTAAEGVTPVYARSSGNASDGQCIAHFDVGDKETLAFTSTAAVQAELVIMMASSNEIADMGAVMEAKLNGTVIDLTGKSFAGGSSSEFAEFSLGTHALVANDNSLELTFKAADAYPYLDDLMFYSKGTATIAVKAAPARETIAVKLAEGAEGLTAYIGEEVQIELTKPTSLEGVSFASDKETVATVSADGKITGVALGTANITVKKDGWYSARVEVTVEKKVLEGEIRVEAENTSNELPSGFHKYTDKTSGITNGHSGSAYITGYDVSSACSLEYEFTSPKDQTMTLIIAGAPHYNMKAGDIFSFANDCEILLNDVKVTVNADAEIEGTGAAMGAATVEVTIGDVAVKSGTNTFVINFAEKAPALDCYRFMPKA